MSVTFLVVVFFLPLFINQVACHSNVVYSGSKSLHDVICTMLERNKCDNLIYICLGMNVRFTIRSL